jgi:hypothetical protein
VTSDQLRRLLEQPPGTLPGDAAIRLVLQHSLNLTFWAMLAIAVATFLVALWVPAIALTPSSTAPPLE